MAINPVIFNEGGIYRFRDYLSQIPAFLREEDDVVVLMQLFSDYINNAYRNIDIVKKFEFKFITVESRVGVSVVRLSKLANLMERSNIRNEKMYYLSKPVSSPVDSNNYFLGIFEYDGRFETLSPNVINLPLDVTNDGDRVYIEFTKFTEHSGSYVYNHNNNSLTLDPFNTSQDPFLNTPNKPVPTFAGLSNRMIEFMPSNISKVSTRKVHQVGNTIYYEVFFTATINNIKGVPSIEPVPIDLDGDEVTDETYLIDYYKALDAFPSEYKYRYAIDFTDECQDFDWKDSTDMGRGMFYARGLTKFKPEEVKGPDNQNIWVDPIYNENITKIPITSIEGDGTNVIVTTKYRHNLNVGDDINILGSSSFDDRDIIITNINNGIVFTYESTVVGSETSGEIIITNLDHYKKVNNTERNKFLLKVPYIDLEGSTEFKSGDTIVRLREEKELKINTFNNDDINLENHYITIETDPTRFNLSIDDYVSLRLVGSATIPAGLNEGDLYKIADILYNETLPNTFMVKLEDAEITAFGSGKTDIVKLNMYFDAEDDVDLVNNTITVSGGIQGNDTDGGLLEVGDAVKIRAGGSTLTLPTPLLEDKTYNILTVDYETGKITLSDNSEDTIQLNTTGSGVLDIVKYERTNDVAIIDDVNIEVAGDSGEILLTNYSGEFITGGLFGKITDIYVDFTATLDSEVVKWNNGISSEIKPKYKKGDYVEYNGSKYKVIKSLTVVKPKPGEAAEGKMPLSPDKAAEYYLKSMDTTMIPAYEIHTNPYMMGMYKVKSLGFEEEPNYNAGFDDLSQDLYVRQVQDLELKFGHDQREWYFSPRLAPPDNTRRTGFLEIIQGVDLENDAVEVDVEPFVKQDSIYSLLLENLDLNITRSVTLEYSEETGLTTATCDEEHRLKSGVLVTISGTSEVELSGDFEITVTGPTTFTYDSVEPDTFTDSGTMEFNNIVDNGTTTYQPVDGDYINAASQLVDSDSGIYIARKDNWEKHDGSKIADNTILYAQQNLFEINDTNPEVAKGRLLPCDMTLAGNVVSVRTQFKHDYSVGTIVNIANASEAPYNGKFEVASVIDDENFTYEIKESDAAITSSPATPLEKKIITSQSNKWYKYTINEIAWQKISNQLIYSVKDGNEEHEFAETLAGNENNVFTLRTEYSINMQQRITAADVTDDYITLYTTVGFKVGDSIVYTANGDTITGLTDGETYTIVTLTDDGDAIPSAITLEDSTGTAVDITGVPVVSDSTFHKTVTFKEGDLVTLHDQFTKYENGQYRVKAGDWQRLNTKLSMKITDMEIDSKVGDRSDTEPVAEPLIYVTYNESEIDADITENFSGNLQIFKVYDTLVSNYKFDFERIENMDTESPAHQMYDARFDKNTVADRSDMKSEFIGVPDMRYPLVEKIERLAYLKDPNVIDFEFIGHLARLMGYDLSPLTDDITESIFYKTQEQKQSAIRKIIQNLPQFNALRSTNTGLEALLLSFGIVGKIVTLWTEAGDPYENFIPDYKIRDLQYGRMHNDEKINLVSTTHFKLEVDIEGNFDNQLPAREIRRLISNIKSYKPINTVFDGVITYLSDIATVDVYAGKMKAIGRLQADVGYDIDYGYGALPNAECI